MEDLIKEIAEKQDIVNGEKALEELDNPHVKRTRLGKINRAKEDLNNLFYDYRRALQERAVFILVTGAQCDKFADIAASEEFGCFVENGDAFYEQMVNDIPPVLYQNKQASRGLFDHFNSQFEARATAIDIISFNAMLFESKYRKPLSNKEDLVTLFKQVFNDKVGSEAVAMDIIDKVSQVAIKKQYSGKVTPIVVFSKDESLIKDFATHFRKVSNNVFIVATGTKVSKDLKDNALCKVKSVEKEAVESSLLKVKENLN